MQSQDYNMIVQYFIYVCLQFKYLLLSACACYYVKARRPRFCDSAAVAILWCWLECNACIFEGASFPLDVLWDRIVFIPSLLCFGHICIADAERLDSFVIFLFSLTLSKTFKIDLNPMVFPKIC